MATEKKDSEDNKQQPKSKYVLATERQCAEVCKCGWNCWKRRGLKCCPGCSPKGVSAGHYREHVVKDGVWISEGEQTCGCRA